MFSTLSHIFISMHCNHCWSFKHTLNIVPSKNLTYFNKTPIIHHKASILKEFYAMPPDSLRTELHDSLTAFYENILKKTKTTTMPELGSRSRRRRRRRCRCRRRQVPLRRRRAPSADPAPQLAAAAEAAAEASAVPPKNWRRRSKGRPDQGLIETCLSLHCCH